MKIKKPITILLFISVLLTAFTFYMETTVWDVVENYPLSQTISDILIMGPIITGVFFVLLWSVYQAFRYLAKLARLI